MGFPSGSLAPPRGRALQRRRTSRLVSSCSTSRPPKPLKQHERWRRALSANAQVDDLVSRLSDLRDRLAKGTGPARYLQAVLATRVDAFSSSRARVVVWSVGVLSRRDVAPPQAGWTTSTFDLVWERADWKVWAEDIRSGPTPMLNEGASPVTDDQFDTALRGFEAWRQSS